MAVRRLEADWGVTAVLTADLAALDSPQALFSRLELLNLLALYGDKELAITEDHVRLCYECAASDGDAFEGVSMWLVTAARCGLLGKSVIEYILDCVYGECDLEHVGHRTLLAAQTMFVLANAAAIKARAVEDGAECFRRSAPEEADLSASCSRTRRG